MNKIYFALVWICLVFFPLDSDRGYAAAISAEESQRILTGIFSKYIPIYTKYRGVESSSRNVLREYDLPCCERSYIIKNIDINSAAQGF
ncbi:MAG: hypothetical protein LUQ56_10450 [Methylococcaceae bacterium]|nr:hypothetical protein [Methylococcaceae bacterium]